MKRILLLSIPLAIAAACVAGLAAVAAASPPDDLQALKAATARYHSFEQAERAGYTIAGEPCVASPAGAMGVHAVNPALLADPAIDPLRPEILLYLPNEQGKLKLVGVEYWRADGDGSLLTDNDRPSVHGMPFEGPMPGHNPAMPVHYDLHVWLWKSNSSGLFSTWNPDGSCP